MDRRRRQQLALENLGRFANGPDAPIKAEADALERVTSASRVILVEGISDQIALETLADRQGRELQSEDVVIIPMGGAHAIERYVKSLGPLGADLALAGMCDAGEEHFFGRALVEGNVGTPLNRQDMEGIGFFVCVDDLEDELIRGFSELAIESLLESRGDLGSFRTLQKQPEWRGREFRAQMHRWLRAGARRNLRYANLLIDSVPLEAVPHPLLKVLAATRPS